MSTKVEKIVAFATRQGRAHVIEALTDNLNRAKADPTLYETWGDLLINTRYYLSSGHFKIDFTPLAAFVGFDQGVAKYNQLLETTQTAKLLQDFLTIEELVLGSKTKCPTSE